MTSYIRVPVSSDHLYHVTNELGQPQNISFIHSQNSSVMILQVQMEALSTSSYKVNTSRVSTRDLLIIFLLTDNIKSSEDQRHLKSER